MADDYSSRYRSSDPYGRPPAQGTQGNDPLAELARLIGKNDPFSESGRDSRPPAAPYDQGYASDQSYAAAPPAPAYGDAQASADWQQQGYPAQQQGYPGQSAHGYDPLASSHSPVPAGPAHYADQTYAAPQPSFSNYQPEQPPQQFYGAPGAQAFQSGGYEQHDGSLPPPHSDEFYDDAPSRRRGLVTVAAVLGLAVVGTAGAFAYRSMFAPGGVMNPPPVIRASAEPNKVAPTPSSNDSAASKITYDRFGDGGQNERVAMREEPPVDVQSLARGTVPASTASAPPPPAATSTPASASNPPSVLTEPRRVRTERIRPEAEGAARSPAVPPMASARQSASARLPEMRSEPSSTNLPPPPPRTAAPRAQPPATQPNSNAPLSLSPDSSAAPPQSSGREAPPRQGRMRVASVPPAAPAAGGGGYLVQVSSQRSESDAQAAFRSLQSKYSSVLGDRQVVIRRADLGQKGVYFRAMVGPFGTRDQAIQLCTSLKAAGGDCVIQSN